MRKSVLIGVAAAFVLGSAALAMRFFAEPQELSPTGGAYLALELGPMTPDDAEIEFFRLAPALLLGVYQGFEQSGETEIYDALAIVADGSALETLYLERIGGAAGGGLDRSDQTVHEMRMTNIQVRRSGEVLEMDAEWEVIGVVGHDEHQHVRGNTYRADLVVAPAQGSWKITDFALRAIDRTHAGELRQGEEEGEEES